jgi:hypothetical protein
LLAQFKGHYSISLAERGSGRVGVAFNYHSRGLDTRTNLYYLQTRDFGKTWETASGERVEMPLKSVRNPALVHDYEAEGLLVYLKDIQFDAQGRPVLVYLTSRSHLPGEKGEPRTWMIARWSGKGWEFKSITTSDHNYDFGQLYSEADGTWRLIAPTDPGPQAGMTGGEVVMWISELGWDGEWRRLKNVTRNSRVNHSYVRAPIDAQADFYAFWADGDPRGRVNDGETAVSRLYFTNKSGDHVWQFPEKMEAQSARPVVVGE